MKKVFVKSLCLMLALVLAVFCFAGCGGNESGGKSEGYTGEVVDLGGKEISVVTWSNSFIPDEDSSSEAVQESYARMKEVEKLYNCKFVVNAMDASEISSAFTTAAMAGQSIGDIILMKTGMATSAYNNNLLLDLSQIFDFENTPFYKPATELLKDSEGKVYSFDIRDFHAVDNMIYFNKDIFDEVGIDIDEVYQLVEDGEWTVETDEDGFFMLQIPEEKAPIAPSAGTTQKPTDTSANTTPSGEPSTENQPEKQPITEVEETDKKLSISKFIDNTLIWIVVIIAVAIILILIEITTTVVIRRKIKRS